MISIRILAILVSLVVLAGLSSAAHVESVPLNITTVKDGFSYPQTTFLNISVADPPPELNIEMNAMRNGTFEPYAGPYRPGEIIQMNVQVQVKAGQPCADRITVEAPVYNPANGLVEIKKVIDTGLYTNTVCPGPKHGMHWMWWDGFNSSVFEDA